MTASGRDPMNPNEVQNQVAKAGTAWLAYGVSSWAEWANVASTIAGVLAAFYSLLLICEWWWKKLWRPLLVRLGYLAPMPAANKAGDE
jgi:hypothetical protein